MNSAVLLHSEWKWAEHESLEKKGAKKCVKFCRHTSKNVLASLGSIKKV